MQSLATTILNMKLLARLNLLRYLARFALKRATFHLLCVQTGNLFKHLPNLRCTVQLARIYGQAFGLERSFTLF